MYLLYSERVELARLYKKWTEKLNSADCPENVITFLFANDLLNIENVKAFLEKGGEQG